MLQQKSKVLYFIGSLPLVLATFFITPACSTDEYGLLKNNNGGVAVSTYDSGKFGGTKCAQPSSKATIPLAFSEGTLGVSCQDNWVDVDVSNLPDVEDGKEREALGGSNEAILKNGLKHCEGICVRMKEGKYQINLPSCKIKTQKNHCDGKVYEITNKEGEKFYGYSHSVCPSRHWKNVLKPLVGYGSLLCDGSSQHVDIGYNYGGSVNTHEEALASVGVTDQKEGLKSVRPLK